MHADQGIVCLIMAKSLGVELDDVELATFVVGVAVATAVCRQSPMIAALGSYIDCNVLVAGHTQPGLCRLVKCLVAGGTIGFGFRMRLDDFAWHEYRFQT